MLDILHCPEADTMYTCDLQSPGLTPLRVPVSVTIIQGMWDLGSSWRRPTCLPWELLLEIPYTGQQGGAPEPAWISTQGTAQGRLWSLCPP